MSGDIVTTGDHLLDRIRRDVDKIGENIRALEVTKNTGSMVGIYMEWCEWMMRQYGWEPISHFQSSPEIEEELLQKVSIQGINAINILLKSHHPESTLESLALRESLNSDDFSRLKSYWYEYFCREVPRLQVFHGSTTSTREGSLCLKVSHDAQSQTVLFIVYTKPALREKEGE